MRLTGSTGFALAVFAFGAAGASAAAPQILTTGFSKVGTDTATLEASVNPSSKPTDYHFEYGLADCASSPCASTEEKELPAGSSPVAVEKATVGGLAPGITYHFRLVAKNGATPADKAVSPDRVFITYPTPLPGLPDNRVYEQASPVDKDGGDAIGTVPQLKASPEGDAITFSSTFGIPGGVGAQEFPLYLASRGAGGWTTQGLLPPPSAGQRAQVAGWLPDFSQVFSSATRLGSPDTGALVAQSSGGGAPQELTPYLPKAGYGFIGSAGEGKEVVFESRVSLGSPAGIEGVQNVYVWNRESGEVSLVSAGNDKQPLAKGAFGGSYDWALGSSPTNLSQGGAVRNYYTHDQHAVSSEGSIFFTEAGSGQLYMRVNPMQPQSKLNGQGKCEEVDMACTIHVSESRDTPPDPAGPRPAAFMGAAEDGSSAFFTSPEKLTSDANTGPEQPKPKIGLADVDGSEVEQDFLKEHRAVGVAVDSKFIYWADPAGGTIGRAELDGENADDEFIVPKPVTIEEEIETAPGEFKIVKEEVASKPNYVAVDAGHIYWTNTADGKNGHGTIGLADIEGTPVSEKPECIKGASNPQGIAVNATHIYWANAGGGNDRSIGRAEIDCEGTEQDFQGMSFASEVPYGVALSATRVYWIVGEDNNSGNSYLQRAPLDGAANADFVFFSPTAEPRGLTTAGGDLYWAAQGDEAIGHAVWPDAETGLTVLEKELIKLDGAPSGIATGSGHIYWSTDGETLPSPGNDLYRFVPDSEGGGTLSDLTPDPETENGAEVQGVVAISKDSSRVYFTANGDLDGAGEAKAGNCVSPLRLAKGQCSLYLWREGAGIELIARLNANGSAEGDAANWAPTTTGVGGASDFQKTAFLSEDGKTLLFRSQEQLSGFGNEGVSELYRYHEGEPVACVSCNPTGAAPGRPPSLGTLKPSALRAAEPASLASRNLSADGDRAFFETTEALVASDTNGVTGCPVVGATLQKFPACQDVYEWEAPESGSCTESSPSYSPQNSGCLYLISTGKDDYPSFFADASSDGNDAFFFTRQGLVGQDKDELLDVYDAKVGGGIAAQNPSQTVPCESTDACHGPTPASPAEGSPTSQNFVGPGNVVSKPKPHKKPKAKKHKAKKKHKKQNHHKQRRANAERRAGR